jgi:hypothetical protein
MEMEMRIRILNFLQGLAMLIASVVLAALICGKAHAQTVPNCPTTYYIMGHATTLWLPCFILAPSRPGVLISLPASATPQLGQTEAEALSLFPYNTYLQAATNPNFDAMFSGMDPVMMARLSTLLAATDVSNYTYSIMAYAGMRLSAVNLRRLQSAFGPAVFATAIAYMPAATLSAYNATPAIPPLGLSEYWNQLNPALAASEPVIGDAWAYALFLDAFIAGSGGSKTAALATANRYANARIHNAMLVALSLAATFLAVYNSPQAQQYLNQLAAWFVWQDRQTWPTVPWYNPQLAYLPSQGAIIYFPASPPPMPDPGPMPELPPIEDSPTCTPFYRPLDGELESVICTT